MIQLLSAGKCLVLVALALGLAACFGNTSSEFPEGLEPLEDNTVPEQQGGNYTETLELVDGEDHHTWVHGRGYFFAPPADVWEVIHDPDLMVSACATTSHSWEIVDDPAYELSFLYHYVVEDLITIEWDEQWRYGTIEGTPAEPTLAIVRYQKVYGSELIRLIEGSIQVLATEDPEVTELQLVEHLDAAGGDASDIRASMQYRFDSIAAVVHGGDAPPCP